MIKSSDQETNRNLAKTRLTRMRMAAFSFSLRFVFNCHEQQVHREDERRDAAGALSDSR